MTLRAAVFLLAAGLAGCAIRSSDYPTHVAKGIEKRTGYILAPESRPAGTQIPDGISLADGLAEDEAVAVALWNNAAFQADLASLGLARADLIEAGLLRNPVLSLLFPIGPKQLEATLTWPLETLWQRPRKVAAAKLDLERVAENLIQNGLNLIRDVKVAYIDLVYAEDRSRLAVEAFQLRRQIAEISESRLRAGDISELEASVARVDATRSEAEAGRLTHDGTTAKGRLRSLLGLDIEEVPFTIAPSPSFLAQEPSTPGELRKLLKDALAARPDLRAAELAIQAARERAGLERTKYFALAGILDANSQGRSGFEAGPGTLIEIPLLNRNQGGTARAKAELERAARQYVVVRHRIALEVEEAHIQFLQAREALGLWAGRIVPPLEEAVRISEKAYAGGDVSYLSVLETTRQLVDARQREAETAADLRRAGARLDWSIGMKRIP